MMTQHFKDVVLPAFPSAKEENWHRHPNGGGWVENTAKVEDSAKVEKYGLVAQHAFLGPYGSVTDRAIIYQNAYVNGFVSDDAEVYGYTFILEKARITKRAVVCENANIGKEAQVTDQAIVSGRAKIEYKASISNSAIITQDAQVHAHGTVSGSAGIWNNAIVKGDIKSDTWQFSPPYIVIPEGILQAISHHEVELITLDLKTVFSIFEPNTNISNPTIVNALNLITNILKEYLRKNDIHTS
jgi:UDP-3-O-[3-hydroxymyristoyl] glucosamine N-acyltransferase